MYNQKAKRTVPNAFSFIILIALSLLFLGKREIIKDSAMGNINGYNEDYLMELIGPIWGQYGKEIVVFSLDGGKQEVYRVDFSEFKPWKIAIGDIDGDGVDEVSIGVYKKSPLHQVMAKRPFIYSFINGKLEPKWRGSRLARPFIDYNFYDMDLDGIDEIIAIEILQNNRKIINTYKWKGFGFEGYLETIDYEDITQLTIDEDKVQVKVKEGEEEYKGYLRIEGSSLLIKGVD